MANTRDFFQKKKDWSIYKDRLLTAYFLPYLNKIMSTRKSIVYIDGFAGKGKFEDNSIGSPLLIKEKIYQAKANSNYNTGIDAYFIEMEYAQELETNLADKSMHVISGDYASQVPIILKQNYGKNIFLYVDPFGIKYLDFSIFSGLDATKYNSVELLLNFNSFGFLREGLRLLSMNVDDEIIDDLDVNRTTGDIKNDITNMNKIANGDYWQQILQGYTLKQYDIFKAENIFLDKYMEQLNKIFKYVCVIPIRFSSSKLAKYQMIFATNNKHGILLMADNMIKCNNDMLLDIRKGQRSLFDYDNSVGSCVDLLFQEIPYQYVEVKDFYFMIYKKHGFMYLTRDMNNALKQLENAGKIDIYRMPALTKNGKPSKSMDFYKNTIKIKRI